MKTALILTILSAQNVETLITKEAKRQNVPVEFALAIARQETNMKCAAIGKNGERGVLQIKPSTAADYGFKGLPSKLNDCQTGIKYGMMYLRAALDRADNDLYVAALMYNGGLYTKKKKSKYAKEVVARVKAGGNPRKA